MLLVKKWIFFFWICFWSKKGLEIRFKDVLDRTESFYDYKNNIFQGLKNGIFPCFWSKKCNFFLDFFSVKTGLEIRFNDVLDRKETFFDCKNNIFQRPQNRTFPKGLTNTFGKKMQFFPFFLFGQNKTRNKVYDVLDRKETLYDNKTTIFQRLKNGIFPKGLTLRLVKKCHFFS